MHKTEFMSYAQINQTYCMLPKVSVIIGIKKNKIRDRNESSINDIPGNRIKP